jgi:hypothetical protein
VSLLVDQPAPVNEADENPAVWASVIGHAIGPSSASLVPDMLARHELGVQRYGVPLRVWNGRDALADAYQEALDLVVYLEQCRLRVPASANPWHPYHPADRLLSLRNEVVGLLRELKKLEGLVPVERPR